MLRVVIDTSVLVSAILSPRGHPARAVLACRRNRAQMVLAEAILFELETVLRRPRIQRRYDLSAEDIENYARRLRRQSDLVETTGSVQMCRDPNDDMLIETALLGSADAIVSRDEDLTRDLDVQRVWPMPGVRVLTVRQFLAELDSASLA